MIRSLKVCQNTFCVGIWGIKNKNFLLVCYGLTMIKIFYDPRREKRVFQILELNQGRQAPCRIILVLWIKSETTN